MIHHPLNPPILSNLQKKIYLLVDELTRNPLKATKPLFHPISSPLLKISRIKDRAAEKVCFVRERSWSANISCLTFHRLKSPVWSSLISSLRRREAKLSFEQNQSFVWSISVFLHCSALIKIDWLLIRNESTQIFCNETLFHSFTAILALFKKCKKYEKNKKLKAHIKYLKMITLKYWHVHRVVFLTST